MRRCGLLLAVAALLGGCSTVQLEFGSPVDPAAPARLVPGRDGLREVLDELGPPYHVAAHAGGYALLYEHFRLAETQVGISGEALHLEVIKAVYGRSGARHAAVIALIGPELDLRGIGSGTWSEAVGSGGGVQLVFDVANVVVSEDLRRPHPALAWGRSCLLPLPSALNQAHRPDLYLRGEPLRMGQFTLEQQRWRTKGRR